MNSTIKMRFVSVCLLNLLILIIGYRLLLQTHLQQFQQLVAKEARLKKQYAKEQQQAAELPAYRQQVTWLRQSFANLMLQMPSRNHMAVLVEEVSQLGIRCGLKIKSFQPQRQIHKNFYTEVPFTLKAQGSYGQLTAFLKQLAHLPKLITVDQFSIVRRKQTGSELALQLSAKAYRYRVDV